MRFIISQIQLRHWIAGGLRNRIAVALKPGPISTIGIVSINRFSRIHLKCRIDRPTIVKLILNKRSINIEVNLQVIV